MPISTASVDIHIRLTLARFENNNNTWGFVGLYLALLVLIIVSFVILVGKSVAMVLLLDLGRVPLRLFRYPPKSGRALLTGTLPLRYCAARFACKTPTWRLPVSGHVARQVAIHCEDAGGHGDEVPSSGVHWVSGSGPGKKRIRLNRKTPAHLVGLLIHSRPRVWKRLRHVGFSGISLPDHTRRRCDRAFWRTTRAQDRIGVG